MKKFNLLACGGTFDHFHRGHRGFLRFALSLSSKVIIGLTSDKFVREKLDGETIESYQKRKEALLGFLKEENAQRKAEIVKINDLFGPTLSRDLPFEAILVTEATKKSAQIINIQRKKINLDPLRILLFSPIFAEDKKPISSARIRGGQINRNGRVYFNPSWFTKTLHITPELRRKLKKPLGFLIENFVQWFSSNKDLKPHFTITVGDVVTESFNHFSFKQKISVVDFRVARKQKFSNISQLGFLGGEKAIKVNNPAGFITPELFNVIPNLFEEESERIVVQINGEEDLVVLPLILASPLGFNIFYGQPKKGVVLVEVDENIKEKVYNFINNLKAS